MSGAAPEAAAPARMSLARLATLYAAFGVVSTVANLGAQWGSRAVWSPDPGTLDLAYWFALAVGTGVGLVVKFVLDKFFIFDDRAAEGAKQHGTQFALYTAMGIATTVIFWGAQSAAFVIWATDLAATVGGAVGLGIGYVVKYQLDKRFVFTAGARKDAGE